MEAIDYHLGRIREACEHALPAYAKHQETSGTMTGEQREQFNLAMQTTYSRVRPNIDAVRLHVNARAQELITRLAAKARKAVASLGAPDAATGAAVNLLLPQLPETAAIHQIQSDANAADGMATANNALEAVQKLTAFEEQFKD